MSTAETTSGAPSAAAHRFFVDLAMGYRSARVVMVANRLGLFGHLEGEWRTPAELAQRVGADPNNLAVLLHALNAIGLVRTDAGRYSNDAIASECLIPGRPGYAGNTLSFLDMLWDCWSHLEDVVRSGKPWKGLPELLGDSDQAFTAEYIRGMVPIAKAPAQAVAAILAQQPYEHLLDVGGGPGTFALALLSAAPRARATILDLATTLRVTRDLLAEQPEGKRVELVPGNYLTSDYGSDFDLVLMSHTTHDEAPANVENMLRRAFSALRPGGRVAIHDWVVVPATGPAALPAALFSVNLTVYTQGRVYSEGEYRELLAMTGYVDAQAHAILEGKVANPTRLVVARKPRS